MKLRANAFFVCSYKVYLFVLCGCVCVYVCAPHACNAHGGQKKAFDSLELEFQVVFRLHVDVGNQIQVLCKSSKYS